MTIGRIGEVVYHPILTRCQGCGQSALMCEVTMDHDAQRCCRVCTCPHDTATLALYGMLEA